MHALPLLLLAACTPTAPKLDDSAPFGDTAPVKPASFSEVSASLSQAIPAVVTVSFVLEGGAGEPWVRFGPAAEDERYETLAVEQQDGSWSAILVGCPPSTTCSYAAGRGETQDQEREITTGEGPDWVKIEGEPTGAQSRGFVLTTALSEKNGGLILDMQGRPVWWYAAPEGDAGGLSTCARLAPDGRSVWFNQFDLGDHGPIESSPARLVQVALDGSWHQLHPLPDNHHDFTLLDDGGLVWLGLEDREIQGELVRGDRLVQRTPAGDERDLWNGWDSLEFDPEQLHESPPGYWTLANHLERDGEDWAISFKNLDTIIGIDGSDGSERWRLGQEQPAIAPDPPFAGQHGFTLLDGSILLFDNGGSPVNSRLLELGLDPDATTAAKHWDHDNGARTLILGDVVRLANGNTIAAWGTAGLIEEVTADGAVLTRISVGRGDNLVPVGFIEYRESIAPR